MPGSGTGVGGGGGGGGGQLPVVVQGGGGGGGGGQVMQPFELVLVEDEVDSRGVVDRVNHFDSGGDGGLVDEPFDTVVVSIDEYGDGESFHWARLAV